MKPEIKFAQIDVKQGADEDRYIFTCVHVYT